MIRAISALVACIAIWLIGCAASQPIVPSSKGKALLGISKQELVACAGNPHSGNENDRGNHVEIL